MRAEWSPELEQKLKKLTIQPRIVWEPGAGDDVRERVAAVKRWFDNDWQKLDNKIKSSIVEGVSVFLSMFDMPDVAAVFCPPPPEISDDPRRIGPKARAAMLAEAKAKGQGKASAEKKAQESRQWPAHTIAERPRYLPPLYELIEGGKVLALNMPAGSNPALARAIGVMLKNAWLQALLMRPAQMKESPSTYFRPAVFICDEYQSFASVGEDDPTGDEKSFALTRQCRCIPIVATQSISSLRAVLGSSEAWRALLQTLRTRIFLSLSDDAAPRSHRNCAGRLPRSKDRTRSARPRSGRACPRSQAGPVDRAAGASAQPSLSRSAGRPSFTRETSPCLETVRPFACPMTERNRWNPGGSISNLITFPWIILIGERRRPDRYEQRGQRACTPETFFPGLEPLLEDAEVSEIMINGPGNVWIEAKGRLTAHAAPGLDESALLRAAIHIARPLGLDPATTPIIDARLDDGSRVAICVPPASPHVAITIRRFGKRTFSAADLVEQKALPENVLKAAEQMLMTRRNILVSGGTGSGKTTLLNALIELLPVDERIVAIEDTLELRIDHSNCVRFEARGLQEGAVTIRDLVRHALRHRPDHIVVGEVRGGEAADLLQALNTGHGGSLTTVHANNAESALSRIASCAMQGGGELPWEVTCRGVVDGIAMVIHMTRREGRRFVEEAAYVKGYDAKENKWDIERLERISLTS